MMFHVGLILWSGCLLRLMAWDQKPEFKLSLLDMAEMKLRRAKAHATAVSLATQFELGLVHFARLQLRPKSLHRDDIISGMT